MATRYMQTDFWTDSKVHNESSPEDRYFMIYLLTNPKTNQLGCYELTLEQMSFDLGYKEPEVEKVLNRLIKNLKFADYDFSTKEILIRNWYKYNWTKSPKVQQYIFKELEKVKSERFKRYLDTVCIPYVYPIDTLCIGYRYNYNNKNKNKIYDKIQESFGLINPLDYELINGWNFDEEIVLLAIAEAVRNKARSIKYVDKILFSWHQNKLNTKEKILTYLKSKQLNTSKKDADSCLEYEVFND